MSLEQEIERVQSHGCRVHNLFQLSHGGWRCNLRRGDATNAECFQFGDAKTPVEAMRKAFSNYKTPPKREQPKSTPSIDDLLG